MINGFTKFKEWFKGFENQYVVIGGTACDLIMELSAHEQAEDSLKFLGIMENIAHEYNGWASPSNTEK